MFAVWYLQLAGSLCLHYHLSPPAWSDCQVTRRQETLTSHHASTGSDSGSGVSTGVCSVQVRWGHWSVNHHQSVLLEAGLGSTSDCLTSPGCVPSSPSLNPGSTQLVSTVTSTPRRESQPTLSPFCRYRLFVMWCDDVSFYLMILRISRIFFVPRTIRLRTMVGNNELVFSCWWRETDCVQPWLARPQTCQLQHLQQERDPMFWPV